MSGGMMLRARFTDNGDGTVSDTATGLMWEEGCSYAENGNYVSWHEANNYVRALNRSKLGGHMDWRLPGRLELQSLYEVEHRFESRGREYVLHLDPLFISSYGSCFWTSKTRLSAALGFEFDVGEASWYPQASLSATARAVRAPFDRRQVLALYRISLPINGDS